MAPLTRNEVSARIKLVIQEKYETHKADIGDGDAPPIRHLQLGPFGDVPAAPAVAVYYRRHTGEDAPQDEGESREATYMVEAVVEISTYNTDEPSQEAQDVADALEWTLKQERLLLHPTTGEKLRYLFRTYVDEVEIDWRHHREQTGGLAIIRIPLRVIIDEDEDY